MKRENHKEGMGEIRSREVTVLDEHDEELDYMLVMAASSPRKRWPKVLNEEGEHQIRLLNAMLPDSYAQPHRHDNFHQTETAWAIRGIFNVLMFNDDGEVTDSIQVAGRKIVSVPPGIWHTSIARTPCIMYITTGHDIGGYDEATHKTFPDWAPKERTEQSERYLDGLKQEIYESEK